MQLVTLKPKGKFVFVGDTHGDLEASQYIVKKYSKPNTKLVFLGDYVDRGNKSKENIEFLLNEKENHPKKIYLLQGNHEGYMFQEIESADFWEKLNEKEKQYYGNKFDKFPLAVSIGDIIATHSGLPDLKNIKYFNKIKNGDRFWNEIVWMDFLENDKPNHLREYACKLGFDRRMKNLNKKLLIRAHNPYAPESMYNGSCVTLSTSNHYDRKRTIAIADFDENPNIEHIDDLLIVTI